MYQFATTSNGIRIVTERVPYVQSVSLGIWVDTGGRDETDAVAGISHFIEHLLFKGTERRSAQQIAEELDAVGGQINAFTDRENTCYYVKVLPEHVPLAQDVLADMLRNSVLDPEEITREKNVILEEIKRHEDTPDELVHDVFAETLWPGHPLGRSVIGRAEVIESLTREQIVAYLKEQYLPGRMVVAAAGNLDHDSLVAEVEKTLGQIPAGERGHEQIPPSVSNAETEVPKPTEQVHFCLGTRGYNQNEEDRYVLGLIDSAVGGGMSSRLFQEVREKRGLCYSIGSYTASFREAGMFTVYAGTSPETAEQVRELSVKELRDVAREGLTSHELQRSKNQIRGAVLLSLDSMSTRMTRIGKSMLYYDRVISPSEVVEKIEAVTEADVRRVSAEIFGGDYAYAAVGPFNGVEAETDEDVE
jgi:predicted Zn-dependent peptidase